MKLLALIPAATTNVFRTLHCVGTAEEFPVGEHPKWDGFGLNLTNVKIIPDLAKDAVPDSFYVTIDSHLDWSVDLDRIDTFSADYLIWCGKHTPSIEAVLEAHMIKGQLPNLVQDFDAFVADLQERLDNMTSLAKDRMTISGSTLIDSDTTAKYNLWAIYRHCLMLDNKMVLLYGKDNHIHVSDTHVSEKGIGWWLTEHNKHMMSIAQQNDLLAAYITFERDSSGYTFVGADGTQVKRPVESSEFMHMAHHGLFPKVVVREDEDGRNFELSFDYAEYFPQAYHDFVNHAWAGRSDRSRDLVRFI
ncbi:hypothetical protein pEaSNUABM21_00050 [Erwinia phage pEa_SNUABM_21]|nr:hypothetical protein pEaSNUABM21_00050 [Erwinia phage pEa_SNUABM_21]